MLALSALSTVAYGGGMKVLPVIHAPTIATVARVGPAPEMFGASPSAAPKKAVVKKPVKKPVAKKPVKKVVKVAKPAAKKVVKKPSAAKKPLAKKPVAKKPVARKPAQAYKARFETPKDLQALALEQNTAIGFWDPLSLADQNFWEQGNPSTIGFLRHAEIKHGRVAMAAFVGYCVQSNGIYFPWALSGGPLAGSGPFEGIAGDSIMFADIAAAGTPGDQWDALPTAAKMQILGTIFILEWIGETQQGKPGKPGYMPHYMRGGKPGYYPPLKTAEGVPHPVPFNLYDPFDLFADMDEATKSRRRNMEINNGRLAMLGIFTLLSASKGLITPLPEGLIPQYSGEYMGVFADSDAGSLPFISEMLAQKVFPGP